MKKSRLEKELADIEIRLADLKNEDEKTAHEIKADLFLLVKISGRFEEYLPLINNVVFTHKNMIINTGNIEKINKFIDGKNSLARIVGHLKKEISLGKLKPEMLPKPETLSIAWLVKNSDLKFWAVISTILIFVFSFGVAMEAKYKLHTGIVQWLIAPSSQLKSTLQEGTKPSAPVQLKQNKPSK